MSKQYDVFAMGAALVDTEIEVSDQDLKDLRVDKGMMTLVDEERRAELMDRLSDHLVASQRASGGSAANTIIAVSAMGGRAFFCGKVANDENGEFYINDMEAAGVSFVRQQSLPEGITGKCLVMITPDAERTMETSLGVSAELSENDVSLEAVEQSEYLYMEGYLATSDSARAAAVAARKHAQSNGTKVAVSLSDPGIVAHFREQLTEITGKRVDLLFANKDEALTWTGTEDIQDACEEMSKWADQYAITLGAEGALIFDGSELHSIPGRAITAVDTNGAGDMFAGAFLYGISQGMSHQEAGELACLAAATVVGQFGPRLPLRQYKGILSGFTQDA